MFKTKKVEASVVERSEGRRQGLEVGAPPPPGGALLSHSWGLHPSASSRRVLCNVSSDSLLTKAAFLIMVLVTGNRVVCPCPCPLNLCCPLSGVEALAGAEATGKQEAFSVGLSGHFCDLTPGCPAQ